MLKTNTDKSLSTQLPLVTIGIPTYNQGHYIAEAITSALAQDYEHIEVIVADDNSPDNTYEKVTPFLANPKVKYYRNIANLGRVGNYRKILYEYATGAWYINLDGDDLLIDDTFISTAINSILCNPNLVLFQATCLNEDPSGNRSIQKDQVPTVTIIDGKCFLLGFPFKYHIYHLGALYNRNKALETDFYRSNTLRSDSESLLRLALKGDVAVYNKAVGVWRDNGNNETWTLSEKLIEEEKAIFDSIGKEASQHIPKNKLKRWKQRVKRDVDLFFLNITLQDIPRPQKMKFFFKYAHPKVSFCKVFIKHLIR